MKTIPISSIIILPDRPRKEFNADTLADLATGIADVGLLCPITLRDTHNPILVAGERRIRAVRLLTKQSRPYTFEGELVPAGHVPYLTTGDADLKKYELIELLENVQRDDLTWQEKANATNRVHLLLTENNPTQQFKETAKLLNVSSPTRNVRDSVIVSKHMTDPDVAKAGSQKEAMKIIKKKAAATLLSDFQKDSESRSEGKSVTRHQLTKGDCLTVMQGYQAETFDCIITDPPYGIGANTFGDQAAGTHTYDDSAEYFQRILPDFAELSFRVCKEQSHCFVFHDFRNFHSIRTAMQTAGWYVWQKPIIWAKGNGIAPQPEHGPRNSYECILFAIKGRRKIKYVHNDVVIIPSVNKPRHAAEKPVGLYIELLSWVANPGDRILDPFAGSGPVFPAANKLSLTAHGINLDEDDYNLAYSRLTEQPQ